MRGLSHLGRSCALVNVELSSDFSLRLSIRPMMLLRVAGSYLGIAAFHSSNANRLCNTQVLYTMVSLVN